MEHAHVARAMHRPPDGLQDNEMSNRRRVFADAMRERPSEIMVGKVYGEVLSSKLRSRKFIAAFQNAEPMSAEEKIVYLGKPKRDYPGFAIDLAEAKRLLCCKGGEVYWVEVDDSRKCGVKTYIPMLIAEAKGAAIAKKWAFSLRFSDALIQAARALDSFAPNSTINPNYHLASKGGMPNEIAEILLHDNDGGDCSILKISLGEISQKGKGRLGVKKEISGALFFMLEGKAMKLEKMAEAGGSLEKFLEAKFKEMESFMANIVPQELAGGLEIYRCLRQVQL